MDTQLSGLIKKKSIFINIYIKHNFIIMIITYRIFKNITLWKSNFLEVKNFFLLKSIRNGKEANFKPSNTTGIKAQTLNYFSWFL